MTPILFCLTGTPDFYFLDSGNSGFCLRRWEGGDEEVKVEEKREREFSSVRIQDLGGEGGRR